jgi:hypothetical protein
MSLLPRPLELHNIRDVEAFCRRILDNHIRKTSNLGPDDYDEALAYLIGETWILSERFTPNGPHVKFSPYAHKLLNCRIVDWRRSRYRTRWQFTGSTHERQRVDPLSLDHHQPDGHPLSESLTAPTGDPATDRDPDLTRLLTQRGSDQAWRERENRRSLHRRAA